MISPDFVANVVACILFVVMLTLVIGWGVLWAWKYVSIRREVKEHQHE